MAVRFTDPDTAEVLDMPAIEWVTVPAARTPYPWPSEPIGTRQGPGSRSPYTPVYVDATEAARWAETPAPSAPRVEPVWTMPTVDGPAPTAGVEVVTRWIAGAEVAVPRVVRRVRPPVPRIVRAAQWIVLGSVVTFVGLAILGAVVR